MLWNKLFEESVEPAGFVESLRKKGCHIVFSPHLRYELSKTFRSTRDGREERGRLLFAYLERYIELGIPCVKQVTDLLREEVKCADGQLRKVEGFYRDEEYSREVKEIRKLAQGDADAGISRVLDFRSSQVREFREESPERSAKWANHLGENGTASFRIFLEARMCQVGQQCLRKHIASLFPELKPRGLKRIARKILSAGRFRLSHALVRGDLYLDWRTVCLEGHSGRSLPSGERGVLRFVCDGGSVARRVWRRDPLGDESANL
jgi:hypothetical protein